MVSAFVCSMTAFYFDLGFEYSILLSVIVTTIVWITVTLLTPPVESDKLKEFYKNIEPAGCWKPYSGKILSGNLLYRTFLWLLSVFIIYGILYFSGNMIFGNYLKGTVSGIMVIILFILFIKKFRINEL